MHKRLVALPGRQAAEHRRGGGREMVSISRVEGRTGGAARMPGVATSREVRAREPQRSGKTTDKGSTSFPPPPVTILLAPNAQVQELNSLNRRAELRTVPAPVSSNRDSPPPCANGCACRRRR